MLMLSMINVRGLVKKYAILKKITPTKVKHNLQAEECVININTE